MLRRTIILFPILLVLSGLAHSTAAEEKVNLEPIIVTAPRKKPVTSPANSLKIETDNKITVSRIPDILSNSPGIDVQRRSILTPKQTQVRLRGLDEQRYEVLLDGRPLNGAGVMGGYYVDWSQFSFSDFREIGIKKGSFDAKYGNTLGGIINFIPESPPPETKIRLHAGIERYGTYSLGASCTGKEGPLGVMLMVDQNKTDGYLRNSHVDRQSFNGHLIYSFGNDGQLSFGIRYSQGDYNMPVENKKGNPGYKSDYPESKGIFLTGPWVTFPWGDKHGDGTYYTKERYELDLGLKKNILGFNTDIKVYFNNEDRNEKITSYNTGETVLKREMTPDRTWGWLIKTSMEKGDHNFGLGGEGNYQGFGSIKNTFIKQGFFSRQPSESSPEWDASRLHGIYVDDTWTLNQNLRLYLGLRYDDFHADQSVDQVQGYFNGYPTGFQSTKALLDDEVLAPKARLTYMLSKGIEISFKGAKAARFPTNPEIYWYYAGYRPEVDNRTNISRKNLTYEDAYQYEVGLDINKIPGIWFGMSYYYYKVDDYIRTIFGYSPSRVVYNIDKVK
ncbi:MAG: hypothetical protein DRG76_10120, partial [Deltaproteobacteria bacterium]